jgi:monoamine oxidase
MEQRNADVCVVGAGFAGLAAARLLKAKATVVVLEARDRVGGRVWAKTLADGTTVSVGGTWIGAGQDRVKALVREVGLGTYPQYEGDVDPCDPGDPLDPLDCGAETILRLDGVNHRYKGLFAPIGLDNLAVLGLAFEQLRELTATLPLDRPWEAPNAAALDAQTLGGWLSSPVNVPSERAQMLLRATMSLLFSGAPEEVSLLGSLVLARGGGGKAFEYYAATNYAETDLVDGDGGGMPEVAIRLGAALGGSIRTSSPVRRIRHSDAGVEVIGDDITVRAKYVIVTAPPILAGMIDYEPPLPVAYGQLMRKMPPGAIWRFVVKYAAPFWRSQGLTGQTVAPDSPVPVSIDQCPKPPIDGDDPPYGLLSCYSIGVSADTMSRMTEARRKETVLRELATRLGDDAMKAIGFSETDWSAEPWSCGGMISHFPTGVLTSFGHVLHEPAGRIWWAGTERATEMHGLIEGAIRSGERAAADVLARLASA